MAFDLRGRGLEHDRGDQVVEIDGLLEDPVDHRLGLGRLAGEVHVGLRPAVAMPPVVVEQPPAHGGVGRLLIRAAQRRPDGQAAGIGVLPVGLEHHLAGHLGGELGVRRQRLPQPLTDEERRFLRIFVHGVVDEAKFVHAPQHVLLAGLGPLGIGHRVEGGGRLRQSGQHRRLGDRDILERLAEVDLRRRGEPVGPLAEEDLVDVQLEDLVLAEARLDLPGQQHFAELARDRLLPREEEVACHLHGDGAGALLGAGTEIGPGGAHHRKIVDTPMLVEPFVLGGQNGLFHDIRDFLDLHHRPPFLAEFPQQVALGRDHAERDFRLIVGQGLQGRQCGVQQGEHQPAQQGPDERQA